MREILRALKRRLTPSGGVTEQTVRSGVWVGLLNVSERALQLGMIVVLANLLSPSEFGLMGFALLTLSALKRFSQLGLDDSLIQQVETNVDGYLDTAWSIQIARGVAIMAVAFLAAPFIAELFNSPQVVDLLRFMSVGPLLLGLQNPGLVYLKKNLDFHKEFAHRMSATGLRVVVSIGYALVEPTVWALAIGYVAGAVGQTATSYLVQGYRPRPGFDLELAVEMLNYGKWILGSGIVAFLYGEGDDVFVGWFLGASALGFYQLAYRLSNAPATEIAQIISRVVFPSYSRIQTDTAQLRDGFFEAVRLTTLVSIPAGVGIIVVTPAFVEAFLGEEWLPMVVPMQILTVYGLFRSCRSPATPLFKATGRPDLLTKIQALKLVLIAAFIYPATDAFGLAGTALVIAGNTFITLPIALYLAARSVDARLRDLVEILVYPAAGAAVMAACVLVVNSSVEVSSPMLEFSLLVATGALSYVVVMAAIEVRFDYGIARLAKTIWGALS